MKKTTLISLILALIAAQSTNYTLVLHQQTRGAACLDGSPPGLYIHQGLGSNKNKFMIYFDGGGFCGAGSLADTLESCYKRSSTKLGSTKSYKNQTTFDKSGILSPLKSQNPVFYDWTKVFIIYCDGSEYLGNRQKPIQYKDKNLYFRGTLNVLEQFTYLNRQKDFYNGQAIVITGVSAGGMATYQWSNYLVQHTKTAKVYAIPDSGFFITDFYSEIAQQKILRDRSAAIINLISDDTSYLPQPLLKCLKKQGLDTLDCLNSANYIEFLSAPMFIIQSPYDAWSAVNIEGLTCLKNSAAPYSLQNCDQKSMRVIEQYRKQSVDYLKKMKAKKNDLGTWSPSCVQHGFQHHPSFTDQKYKVNGTTLANAVQRFIDRPQNPEWLLEDCVWPCNAGCSGKINGQRQIEKQYKNIKKQQ